MIKKLPRAIGADAWSYDQVFAEKQRMERELQAKEHDTTHISMGSALRSLLKKLETFENAVKNGELVRVEAAKSSSKPVLATNPGAEDDS